MRSINLRRLAVASVVMAAIDASFGWRVGDEHRSQATPVSP
jgi:hypothetical protein